MWRDKLKNLKSSAIRAIGRYDGEQLLTKTFHDIGEARCIDIDDAWIVLVKGKEPFVRGKRDEFAHDNTDDVPLSQCDFEFILEIADSIRAGERYRIQGFRKADGNVFRHTPSFAKYANAKRALSALEASGRYRNLTIIHGFFN